MAFSVKSTVLSSLDATPLVKADARVKGGVQRTSFGYLTILATTAGQTNAFCRVPARARLVSVKPRNAATMGNGSVKIGFYRTGDGIEVKSDAITAAMALTAQTGVDVYDGPTMANRALAISDWLVTEIGTAGATSDVEFDVVATVVTVSTGTAVAHALEVEYILPE